MHKHFPTPIALAIGAALAISGCSNNAQDQNASAPAASATAPAPAHTAAAPAPAASVAITPEQPIAFDLDDQYNPCNDFADYVNAKWNKANPIPADQTRWGAFGILHERSLQQQKQILEAAAQEARDHKGNELEQKLGNLYAAGLDTATIDKLGYDPIKPQLAAIDALKTPADIADFIDTSYNNGDSYIFNFGSGADFKDATRQIGYVYQDGLGLPTRDYYLSPKYKDIRDAYVKYIAKSLELVGTPAADAQKQADAVMAFETGLAKASLSPVELRNLDNRYHFVTVAEADKVSPHFSWDKFFKAQGVDVGKGFSLSQPKFIAEFDKLLATAPVPQWQAYLKFHLVSNASTALSQAFQDNRFDFYDKTLRGQPEQKDRWKRVVDAVNDAMGMGLGELYVARYFPPEAKERAEQLVTNVRAALKEHIENLDWMSAATKQKALEKWALFLPKIGYPDKGEWRDWSGLTIQPDQWYANLEAASKYNYHYDIAKIGKPTDRKEWHMTPQTINAYYSPSTNTINFPAAILQPPFFYAKGDDAVNYGGIGFVIGHESSHGFDDQGSQFDGHGNRADWWTPRDKKAFDERTAALAKQYDGYTPIPGKPDLHVNGKLTLGEDIGDLGGLNIAYTALQAALKADPAGAGEKIDGMTQDQRFFLNSARVWEGTTRDKTAELLLNVDPHAPAKIRAFASAANMPQFAQAFQCKPGDKMAHTGDQLVKIW
ncbi:MAG: M13 family metallopeptidase [Xanthomonadales bacterium]|nr:M13 family metallopeptidase [Xanthomonadales bacterium]ODU93897.1 MAG: peptidase [Rhodanobacter sp. SCN 66-43]OJY82604.1 MAG: peptidase [Xanthomonadales bacterium 66-474]